MKVRLLAILPLILVVGILLGHLMQVLASPGAPNPGHTASSVGGDTDEERTFASPSRYIFNGGLIIQGNFNVLNNGIIWANDINVRKIKTTNNRFSATNINSADNYWFQVNGENEANNVLGLYSDGSGNNKVVNVNGNLNVIGNVKIKNIVLDHVTGTNPTCPTGSFLMRKGSTCSCGGDFSCSGCSCTVGWTTKDPLSCSCTWYKSIDRSCSSPIICYCEASWSEAICAGN